MVFIRRTLVVASVLFYGACSGTVEIPVPADQGDEETWRPSDRQEKPRTNPPKSEPIELPGPEDTTAQDQVGPQEPGPGYDAYRREQLTRHLSTMFETRDGGVAYWDNGSFFIRQEDLRWPPEFSGANWTNGVEISTPRTRFTLNCSTLSSSSGLNCAYRFEQKAGDQGLDPGFEWQKNQLSFRYQLDLDKESGSYLKLAGLEEERVDGIKLEDIFFLDDTGNLKYESSDGSYFFEIVNGRKLTIKLKSTWNPARFGNDPEGEETSESAFLVSHDHPSLLGDSDFCLGVNPSEQLQATAEYEQHPEDGLGFHIYLQRVLEDFEDDGDWRTRDRPEIPKMRERLSLVTSAMPLPPQLGTPYRGLLITENYHDQSGLWQRAAESREVEVRLIDYATTPYGNWENDDPGLCPGHLIFTVVDGERTFDVAAGVRKPLIARSLYDTHNFW